MFTEHSIPQSIIPGVKTDASPAPEFQNLQIVKSMEGALNKNFVVQTEMMPPLDRVVLRFPKSQEERVETQTKIQEEYDAIGATSEGIGFHLRTIDEQIDFLANGYTYNLQLPQYYSFDTGHIVFEFIDGTPLNTYIQEDTRNIDFRVIENILKHMKRAHDQGVIFGDRWVTNTMILPTGEFRELDFDIELIGDTRTVATFELAQTLFHLMHFSGQNREYMRNALQEMYKKYPDMLEGYDMEKLDKFMHEQAAYFSKNFHERGQTYEGLIPPTYEVSMLVNELDSLVSSRNKEEEKSA